jgi:hypothetical protein
MSHKGGIGHNQLYCEQLSPGHSLHAQLTMSRLPKTQTAHAGASERQHLSQLCMQVRTNQ